MLHSLHNELEPVESGMEFAAANSPQKPGADAEPDEVMHQSCLMRSGHCLINSLGLCVQALYFLSLTQQAHMTSTWTWDQHE
jgi:hypothetical protein